MGVRITNGTEAVLYCSTTMWAFGPVFTDYDEAEEFLTWSRENVAGDLRLLTDAELEKVHSDWRAAREVKLQPEGTVLCDNCGEYVSEWIEMESLRPGGETDRFCHTCAPHYQKEKQELRADLDDFIRTSEWVKESDRRAKEAK